MIVKYNNYNDKNGEAGEAYKLIVNSKNVSIVHQPR